MESTQATGALVAFVLHDATTIIFDKSEVQCSLQGKEMSLVAIRLYVLLMAMLMILQRCQPALTIALAHGIVFMIRENLLPGVVCQGKHEKTQPAPVIITEDCSYNYVGVVSALFIAVVYGFNQILGLASVLVTMIRPVRSLTITPKIMKAMSGLSVLMLRAVVSANIKQEIMALLIYWRLTWNPWALLFVVFLLAKRGTTKMAMRVAVVILVLLGHIWFAFLLMTYVEAPNRKARLTVAVLISASLVPAVESKVLATWYVISAYRNRDLRFLAALGRANWGFYPNMTVLCMLFIKWMLGPRAKRKPKEKFSRSKPSKVCFLLLLVLSMIPGVETASLYERDSPQTLFVTAMFGIISWVWSTVALTMSFWCDAVRVGFTNLLWCLFQWLPITLADFSLTFSILVFAIMVLRKRFTPLGSFIVITSLTIMRYAGVFWCWQAMVACTTAVNLFTLVTYQVVWFPGLVPMMFITSFTPVSTFLIMTTSGGDLLFDVQVPCTFYLLCFFSVLALEFAPLINKPVLVIERDVATGRVIKQELKSGLLSKMIFGDVSVTWDALAQSVRIGEVTERTFFKNLHTAYKNLTTYKNNAAVLRKFDPNDVKMVTDMRASGYIRQHGTFIANCQSVKVGDETAILANIHAVFDPQGKVREGLTFVFPATDTETTAEVVIAKTGADLALLRPVKPIKYAWRVGSQQSTAKAMVAGYNRDETAFQKFVERPKTGLVQIHLDVGHSGAALINPETGVLTGILWLTAADAKLAQFVGLNPLLLSSAGESWSQVSVSQVQLARGDLEDARQKLKAFRVKMLKGHDSGPLSDINKRLNLLEETMKTDGEPRFQELVVEHRMWLQLAEEALQEKKTLAQKLKVCRSEREDLLRQKSKTITEDNGLLAELKLEVKKLQQEYDNAIDKVKTDYGYTVPSESRMPGVAPKVCWPILFKDGDKWVCYWSKTEREEYPESPVMDDGFIKRVQKETGLNRKNAIKLAIHHLYNPEWAKSIIEKAPLEQSVIRSIVAWLLGDSRVYCGYCDRTFECEVNHKHDETCKKRTVLDAERHRDYCGSNHYEDTQICIEGWNYPVVDGRIALGYKKHILAKCQCVSPGHTCFMNVTPVKRSDFYRLQSKSGTWWVNRKCVENLIKDYRDTEIPFPENEELAAQLAEQVTATKQSAKLNNDLSERLKITESALKEAKYEIGAQQDTVSELEAKIENMARELEAGMETNVALKSEIRVLNTNINGKEQALKTADKDKAEAISKLEATHKLVVDNLTKQIERLTHRLECFDLEKERVKDQRQKLESKKAVLVHQDTQLDEALITALEEPTPSAQVGKKQRSEEPIGPFVVANPRIHQKWNKGVPCQCHLCECKNECKCTKVCIHCNEEGHYIDECQHAKAPGKCGKCGNKPSRRGGRFCCEVEPVCVLCLGAHHAVYCHARKKAYYYRSAKRLKVEGAVDFERMLGQPDFRRAPPPAKCGWSEEVAANLRAHSKNGTLTLTYTGGLFSRALLKLVPKDLNIRLACTPTSTRDKIMVELGNKYPLVSFEEHDVAVDPYDLEYGLGVFTATCVCGECVINFTRDTCVQSAAPVKNLRHLLSNCFDGEDMSLANSRQAGPGFDWLKPKEVGAVEWPSMPPVDIVMRTDWMMKAPHRVGVSDKLPPHEGSITNEGMVPQRGEKPMEERDYHRKESKRYPTVTAHKHLRGDLFVPSSPCLLLARDDVQKYGNVQRNALKGRVDKDLLIESIIDVLTDLKMQVGEFELASWDQVVAQRNWNTSPGYPYNSRFSTCKAAYEHLGEYIRRNMDQMFLHWCPTIWNVIAKDEVLPKNKAAEKVRTIMGPSLDHQLVSQILTLNIVNWQNSQHEHSHSQLGSSKYHGNYHRTIDRLKGTVVEYDAKGWDRNVHPTLLKMWFWVFWCLLKTTEYSNFVALSNVFESIIYSYLVYANGQIVRKHGGLPSGCTLTANLNTLIHMTMQRYSQKVTGSPLDFICYGDDGLMVCEGDPKVVREVFALFGMNLDKNFRTSSTPIGLTWLGTTVGEVNGKYVPLGDPVKNACHAYWSSGQGGGEKTLSYELVVAYALYSDLIWNEMSESVVMFRYLQELAERGKEEGVSGTHHHETLGTIDASSVVREVCGFTHKDVNMYLRAKLFTDAS